MKKLTPRGFFFSILSHGTFFVDAELGLDQGGVHAIFLSIGFGDGVPIVTSNGILHYSTFRTNPKKKENLKNLPLKMNRNF